MSSFGDGDLRTEIEEAISDIQRHSGASDEEILVALVAVLQYFVEYRWTRD